ncbi:MAG: helix-turn-helix domain-containing protein [Spirochaetaceae bacterium]|nr:MAG: helix-turn-helix domain-containing protein [Spirochaetaceae bacterium]
MVRSAMDSVAVRVADALAAVSGVECHYLSVGDAPAEAGGGRCGVCEAALEGHPAPSAADRTHRFAAYQSERLGGQYVYVCPFTLLHIAGPVVRGDTLEGVIVCGPAVLAAVDDSVVRAVRSSRAGALMSQDAVAAWVRSLPELSPSQATSLSVVVGRLASTCRDGGSPDVASAFDADASFIESYLPRLESMEGRKRSSMRYPLDKEQELIERVRSGDRNGAERVLAQILAVLGEPGPSGLEEFRSRVLELVVLLSRASIAGGADAEQVFGLEYQSLSRLRTLGSTREISGWLARILRRFTELVFDLRDLRYTAHLSRVLRTIHRDYGQPITLARVAAQAGISAGYLSRIFKQEMKSSFSSYVTRVRLQEARLLLRTTLLPVGEIAYSVGFPDQSYFAQVYRRTYGQAPTEYRLRGSPGRQGA